MFTFLIITAAVTGWGGLFFVAWSLARANRLEDSFEMTVTGSVAEVPAPLVAKPKIPVAVTPGRTIFVVDDDPGVLELVTEVLKLQGFTVKGFIDPTDALTEFRSHHGNDDLLVTDYRMGSMTGLELIASCRTECPRLRSVVISGIREEDELARIPLESDRFLAKPFTVQALMESIETTLATSKN
jgi:CheY-like chemotaxis protein